MVFRSSMNNALMPKKMRILNRVANRKGWVLSLSILQQVNFNRMAVLNKKNNISNSVHAILTWEIFLSFLKTRLWAEAANRATLLENNLLTLNRAFSPFQQLFWKGREKHSIFGAKIWWNRQRHTLTMILREFQLVLLKVTQSVPTLCITPRPKK